MARKKKEKDKPLTVVCKIRMTEDMNDLIERYARGAKLTKSEYIRKVLYGETPVVYVPVYRDCSRLIELFAPLVEISRRINAMAKALNYGFTFTPEMKQALLHNIDRFMRSVISFSSMRRKLKEVVAINIFQIVKANVTSIEATRYYGVKISGKDMAHCIFHNDHTPSMKLDRRYYCFGCQETGDVIDFVAQLFGINKYDAAVRLASDFRINIDASASLPVTVQIVNPRVLQRNRIITTIKAYRNLAFEWKQASHPAEMILTASALYMCLDVTILML